MQLGLFERHGAHVRFHRVPGGAARVTAALMEGSLDFAHLGASAIVRANLDGADLVAVIGLAGRLVNQVMARPDIRRMEDLRGRRLARTSRGSDAVLWHWILPRYGLRPDRDVNFVDIEERKDQMNALRDGTVDAITLSPSGSTYLRKEGYRELVDFSKHDADYALGCLVTTRRLLDARPEEALRYVSGYVEAVQLYNKDRELGIRVLRDYTHIEDDEVLGETYDVFHRAARPWPYPSVAGFAAVIETLALLDSRATAVQPATCIDGRLLDQLREHAQDPTIGRTPGGN